MQIPKEYSAKSIIKDTEILISQLVKENIEQTDRDKLIGLGMCPLFLHLFWANIHAHMYEMV